MNQLNMSFTSNSVTQWKNNFGERTEDGNLTFNVLYKFFLSHVYVILTSILGNLLAVPTNSNS